jgi:xylulokinase
MSTRVGVSQRILAIDAGTSCIKAVVVSLPEGVVHNETAHPLDPPASASSGYAEQRAEQWSDATAAAIRSLGAGPGGVDAIALSGQMQSVLLVDVDGQPLLPALLYSDSRATTEASRLEAVIGRDRLLRETCNWKGAVSVLPKLCWLYSHHPDLLERAAHILLGAHDWIFFWLTGEAVTDMTNASVTGLLRSGDDEWAADMMAEAGLPAWLVDKLPALSTSGPAMAWLKPAAAESLGWPLASFVRVCHGAGDLGTATVGALGGSPGTYCYLGTSGWVATLRGTESEGDTGRAFRIRGATRDRTSVLAAPTTTAGGNLRWLAGVLWPELPEAGAYAAMEAEASAAPPGCDAVIYLPYISGERCPVNDPQARACFVGMGLGTGRPQMCRAVLEGLCFAVRSLLELLPAEHAAGAAAREGDGTTDGEIVAGCPPPLVLVGGVARSATLVQTLANVLQREIRVPSAPQHAPALGAARLALAAMTGAPGASETAPMPEYARSAFPDAALQPLYERRYSAFCALHPALRDTFPRLRP